MTSAADSKVFITFALISTYGYCTHYLTNRCSKMPGYDDFYINKHRNGRK